MRTLRRGPEPRRDEVTTITSARPPLAEDIGRRTSKYLISMSIRTVCLILAVVVQGPLMWVFLAGAVVLPYVAVVLANAGREREEPPGSLLEDEPVRRIAAGPPAADVRDDAP